MAQSNALPTPRTASKSQNVSIVTKIYLVTYNILSTIGWAYVLSLLLIHIFNLDGGSDSTPANSIPSTASSTLSHFLSSLPWFKSYTPSTSVYSYFPSSLQPFIQRMSTSFKRVGVQTTFVQSFALLEVLHALLGLVRSPVGVTTMQVSSRLFLVWGIAEQYPVVRTNALYTTMVFAWSTTEVIRYSCYALSLMGSSSAVLTYLRYTTFYILYPLGASSEAFLMYATLPRSSPIPGQKSWLEQTWSPYDYIRAGLFVIWWPGLYILYTYMISQRQKVLHGKSRGIKHD